MKYKLHKKLIIQTTLDSSEAAMFQQGGLHSVKIDSDESLPMERFDEIEVTFQIEKSQFSRLEFVNSEAKKHREQWDEINSAEAREAAKSRMESNLAEFQGKNKPKKGLKGAVIKPQNVGASSAPSKKRE